MAQKGLTKELVVQAAAGMIEQNGIKSFSIHSLAERLGVKPASLYNHIENMDALLLDVCVLYLREQDRCARSAIAGRQRDEAVRALAESYYRCAKEHRELYRLMIRTATVNKRLLDEAAVCLTEPLKTVMADYGIREEEKIHFRRLFRAILHGFVSEEEIGFFSHYPAGAEDSFRFSIDQYIERLKQAEREAVQ